MLCRYVFLILYSAIVNLLPVLIIHTSKLNPIFRCLTRLNAKFTPTSHNSAVISLFITMTFHISDVSILPKENAWETFYML